MPGVKPQRNEINLGFAGNINRAVERAKGDYILLLNQDIRALPMAEDAPVVRELLKPGWADVMLRVFGKHKNVGIVGPRLIFPTGHVQSVGGIFDAGKGPYHRYLGWADPTDRRINTTEKVSWITGATMMMRRDDFMAVGGLRGDLYPGGYFEDTHLCMNMRVNLKKDIWYCAEATLIHQAGSSGGNPKFMQNSMTFHRIWDRHIAAETNIVYVNY